MESKYRTFQTRGRVIRIVKEVIIEMHLRQMFYTKVEMTFRFQEPSRFFSTEHYV